MATDKTTSEHNEHVEHAEHCDHEAVLTGVVALAALFSNCVEAFGLIHPGHKWEKDEQLQLARLGLQQARLLLLGDVLGISSPPKSVTDRAVPKYPSSAYPDLSEPTFFGARDPRLDEPETRMKIEDTLSAILDRPKTSSREEMMSKYGLKPPKRPTVSHEPALDTNRLEAFRERWELLQEVAESYAHISTRRANSILHTSWQIADCQRFADFVSLTQEKVDYLIALLAVHESVDRGVRMDIRSFGWHIAPDRARLAVDTSKLRLLQEICRQHYPQYVIATTQALEQIERETRESNMHYNPYAVPSAPIKAREPPASPNPTTPDEHRRRSSGFFGLFKGRGKHEGNAKNHARKDSGLAPPSPAGPERSMSDSGPATAPAPSGPDDEDNNASLGRVRSKSVGAWIDAPTMTTGAANNSSVHDEALRNRLEKLDTVEETTPPPPPPPEEEQQQQQQQQQPATDLVGGATPQQPEMAFPDPIRHDQYRGIARTDTKDLHQADF